MIKLQIDENDHVEEYQTYCGLPYTKLILNSWGEVSMCCHQLTQLGKIDENTNILDLWNSDLAKEIRKTMDAGKKDVSSQKIHRVYLSHVFGNMLA